MDKPVKNGVPKLLFILIVVILASMFYYAVYHDYSNPEVTVRNYYHAYFKGDYPTMAQNLSVFWGAQFMPQYLLMSPQEKLENRPAIEKNMAEFIARMESPDKVPAGMSIKILSKYTQREENTALVVYEIKQNNRPINLEMAILLKENDRMYILLTESFGIPFDITAIEEDYKALLSQ